MAVKRWATVALVGGLLGCSTGAFAAAPTTAEAQLAAFAASAGQAGQANKGKVFFNSTHGTDWRCATCHTANPLQQGKHAVTGKVIAPMAPAANPERFTDAAKTEKWFRRNCNDVVGRECTAAEKADFLAYLVSLK